MLLTAAQMQAADACALEQGIDSFLLMQSAGRAVAETVLQQVDRMLCRVLVVAGPGNNGGDGAVAAVELARYGIDVSIVRFGKPAVDQTDAGKAFKHFLGDAALAIVGKPQIDFIGVARQGIRHGTGGFVVDQVYRLLRIALASPNIPGAHHRVLHDGELIGVFANIV